MNSQVVVSKERWPGDLLPQPCKSLPEYFFSTIVKFVGALCGQRSKSVSIHKYISRCISFCSKPKRMLIMF